MGLVVWLPLNGDTVNQGISTQSFSISNNSMITVDNAGKIGKCYNFNSSSNNNGIYSADNGFMNKYINNKSWSICAWVCTSSTDTCVISLSYGLRIFCGNSTYVSLYNSSRTVTCTSSVAVKDGKWHHICATYDKDSNIITFYVDGVSTKTTSYTSGYIYASSWTNGLFIGKDPNNSTVSDHYLYKGKMNDVRIYNHCLSAAEVHEISQGLMLHYKLDGYQGGITNPNLISNIDTSFLSYANGAVTLFSNQMNGGAQEVISNFAGARKCLHLHCSGGNGRQYQTISATQGKTYTVSADYYCTTTRTNPLHCELNGGNYSWTGFNSQNYTTPNQWQHLVATYSTALTSNAVLYYFFYCNNGYDCYIKNIKIEEGTSATPWCPADTQTPVNRTVVPDSSGYDRHGTVIGTPTFNGNTARYSVSTYLDTGVNTRIVTPSIAFEPHAVTMSIWFRSTSTSPTGSYHMVVDSNANRQWYEMAVNSGGFFRCGLFVNGTRYAKNGTSTNILNGNWHMLTVTYDGSIIKRYVDGIMEADSSITYSTGLSSPTALTIGRDGPSASYAVAAAYLSDFRVYCTALSAADILQLYKASAKIDKPGNLHTYTLEESEKISVKKSGIVSAARFAESDILATLKYDNNVYIEPDGSMWVHLAHHNNPYGSGQFSSTDSFATGVYLSADKWYDFEQVIASFDKYEFMVKQLAIVGTDTESKYRWIQTKSPLTATWADVNNTAVGITKITTTGYYTHQNLGGLYITNNRARLCIANNNNGNWYGAFGCWQWTGQSVPCLVGLNYVYTGYMDLYVRIDNVTLTTADKTQFKKNGLVISHEFIEM